MTISPLTEPACKIAAFLPDRETAEQLAAFGDDENDLEMLKACGRGIAVANGLESVKAAADEVCESNDSDGVAKWLETNVLGL